jgi:rubrerythrin
MIQQEKIDYMLEDEVKASKEYAQLARDNPEYRKQLMKISRQEAEHARFWRSI